MANLLAFSDIRNLIQIEGFYCGKKGLQIHYTYGRKAPIKEHILTANPEQACDLLKHIGIIEEYAGAGEEVAVECWHENELTKYHWLEFIFYWDGLEQFDAMQIATFIEHHKQMEEWRKEMFEIPTLVKRIGGAK